MITLPLPDWMNTEYMRGYELGYQGGVLQTKKEIYDLLKHISHKLPTTATTTVELRRGKERL